MNRPTKTNPHLTQQCRKLAKLMAKKEVPQEQKLALSKEIDRLILEYLKSNNKLKY